MVSERSIQLNRVDIEQLRNQCTERVSTSVTDDYVELDVDAGAYRILVGFDKRTLDVSSSAVSERPNRPRVAAPEFDDGSDDSTAADQWEAAGRFLANGVSFGKAVASKAIQGPVTGAKLDHRRECCFGKTVDGETWAEPCGSMVTRGGNNYCRSCGCGEKRKRARLNPQTEQDWNTSKLAYPHLNCPLGRFGPVAGSRNGANNGR